MASSVLDICTVINDRDAMKRAEAPEFDESLFTYLLEDSQDEGCNDERLYNMIQSLESEINPCAVDDMYDFNIDVELFSNGGSCNDQMYQVEDGHGWHLNNFLLECANSELAACPVGGDMESYMDTSEDEMADFTELGELGDYFNVYNDVSLEGRGCSSLW